MKKYIYFLTILFISYSHFALSQEEVTEYFFAWNGDQELVKSLSTDDQWLQFGNRHESKCDLEVSHTAAVAGTRDVTLRSGRRIFVPNMSRDQAKNLWMACMRSEGWELHWSESAVISRRNELRSKGIISWAMSFTKSF
jgi:hypothetical protein